MNEHREKIRQWQHHLLNLANTLGYRISGMVDPTQDFYDDTAAELEIMVTRIRAEADNYALAEKLQKKPGDGQSEIR